MQSTIPTPLNANMAYTRLHSGNLYQIFTYVKNKELEFAHKTHKVAGMLLYAKTDEEIVPNREYSMSGNKIAVRTLDLGVDFSQIRKQLDEIAATYFPNVINTRL